MTAPREPYVNDPGAPLGTRRFGGRPGGRPSYLTTEFLVLVVLSLAILLAALIVQDTHDHGDYFRADRAWWYITLLGVAYIVSRGLSKIGSGRRDL